MMDSSRVQVDNAAARRDGHALRAVARPQLLRDVPDVHLDRLLRDKQQPGYLLVAAYPRLV